MQNRLYATLSKRINKNKKKSSTLSSNDNDSVNNSKSNKKRLFICPFCPDKRVFIVHQALGGHLSNSHPNMSPSYIIKKERRNERAP